MSSNTICAQTFRQHYQYDTLGNRSGRTYSYSSGAANASSSTSFKTESEAEPMENKAVDAIPDYAAYRKFVEAADTASWNHGPLMYSPAKKRAYQEEMEAALLDVKPIAVPHQSAESYCVGQIPLESGVSPSGARTYRIPIATAPGIKYAPSLALVYNSQGEYGYGGYGWDLAGLSEITLTRKTLYYDGIIQAADVSDTSAVFMLDGVRLVNNDDSATSADYPLVTASGRILAAPVKNASGYVRYFNVLYPNGVRATYGSTSLNINSNNLSYPMVESVNLDGEKIKYNYSFDSTDGSCYLTGIHYGFDSLGNAAGVIEWQYTDDAYYQYYAGKRLRRKPRIDNLVSMIDGVTVFYYGLTYSWISGTPLLTSVSLSTSQNHYLPPLLFTYGPDTPHSGPDSLLLTKSIPTIITQHRNLQGIVYERGKFVKSSYNDGILVYPDLLQYRSITSSQFEYSYPSTQRFAFASSVADVTQIDTSLFAGADFLTMNAVDADGDGVDEVVKVSLGSTSQSGSYLIIREYKSDSNGNPTQCAQYSVFLQGSLNINSSISPYRRTFRWGDFNGDGKTELLSVSFSDNGFNFFQTPYITLIDLSNGQKLYEDDLFNLYAYQERNLFCLDLDSDGRTELCLAGSSGTTIFSLNHNNVFEEQRFVYGLSSSIVSSDNSFVLDINSDGNMDFMKAPQDGSSWILFTNTGTGFESSYREWLPKLAEDVCFFIDINRDGYPDALKLNASSFEYAINNGGQGFGPFYDTFTSLNDTNGIIPGNVIDRSSMASFIKIDGGLIKEYTFTSFVPEIRQLIQSKDSFGKIIRSSYSYLPQSSLNWTEHPTDIDSDEGFQLCTLPLYVLINSVGFMSENSGAGVFQRDYYSYYDGVLNTRGLGWCGFSKIRKSTYLDAMPIVSVTRYNPQHASVPVFEGKYLYGEAYMCSHSASYEYDNHSTTYGKLSPRMIRSVENDNLKSISVTTTYSYDGFDFPVSINSSGVLGTNSPMTVSKSITYSHSNSPSEYALGTVIESTVSTNRDSLEDLWQERTSYTYDSLYRPLTKRISVREKQSLIPPLTFSANDTKRVPRPPVAPFETVLLQRWTYDPFGNVLSDETARYNATEFIGGTYTYDSSGRHLISETDALGHTTTYADFDILGNPHTSTDYRGRVTSRSYDAWGNLTKTVFPDGTVDSTALSWGGCGVYVSNRTVSGAPPSFVHYDAFSREVRRGTQRFNGQWRKVDTEYNSNGSVKRVSLPYRGTSPSYWNKYYYDVHDRPTGISRASGHYTSYSYSGSSVTESDAGISITRTYNALGDLVSASDAAGTTTYTLRDDGQPSSITAPGGITTAFQYDDYGRRTAITDPSAGIRITSYEYNSDGSSVTTETNSLGTISTSLDKYGRITCVTRTGPGAFNTSYYYDSYGKNVAVVSTNGTNTTLTYDAYDRIATVKETVPDNKWLQKTYSYGPGGRISSISYTSQSGYITTENYTYGTGVNTAIKLADGTTVISIGSENDFGQPLSATTGSVSRTYAYTDYGLPTDRKLQGGTLQNEHYGFAQSTGNLSMRIRNNNTALMDTFSYDNLGRLTSVNSGSIIYDDKGNLLANTDVGAMSYSDDEHPYRITQMSTGNSALIRFPPQNISYTTYNRPYTIAESTPSATFTYNANYERVRMRTALGSSVHHDIYYIGDRYEREESPGGSVTERLFIGGDAYSAPMVMQRTGNGTWTKYVIGRDYLGSITQLVTTDGTLVAEYSYDAWGRMRNPATNEVYGASSSSTTLIGRGYCGHEHLTYYGLINMNARLYDPVIGRFLSPDPYVQAPDFSQNFNRYSYVLNNPLKYTDESGEFIISTAFWVSIGIGAIVNLAFNWGNIDTFGEGLMIATAGALTGAITTLTGGVSVAGQIVAGMATGFINSSTSNLVQQLGPSGNGSYSIYDVDFNSFRRSVMSGSINGGITNGLNSAINNGWISKALDKLGINNSLARNVIGNTIEGSATGLVAGSLNGLGNQFVKNGFTDSWSWKAVGNSVLLGIVYGGLFGATNGLITEEIYQRQLKDGYSPFRSSDMAEAAGELAGASTANLGSSRMDIWPIGHYYAIPNSTIAPSICIDVASKKCTITIDPYSPMVPSVTSYYYP